MNEITTPQAGVAKAPVITTPNPSGTGHPEVADSQYQLWLSEMSEWLRRGCTLYYAMDKAELLTHKDTIYRKYKSTLPADVWFSEKVDRLRATLGEMTNDLVFKVIERAKSRLVEDNVAQLTDNEVKVVKLVAERHRTAQPFFVNRTESAEADDSKLGKIIDTLEKSNYDDLAGEAKKQMVAVKPPVQNQGQAGQAGSVQTQPNAAQAPSGSGQSPVPQNP